MAQVNLADYKNLYIETVKKSINNLSELRDKLAANAMDKEALNNLHIASHSLKGRSQVMGYAEIANLAENIEKKSDGILNGIIKVDDQFIIFLKNSINEISLNLNQVTKGDAA